MDNDLILRQFNEIEERIEHLLEACKTLEATNADLVDSVTLLEAELQDKVEAEKRYSEEKALVKSKIDGLLVKLGDASDA